jgi:GDPmannose 4,6-dehydratase
MKNIAFITGVSGQDGSYLAEFLLDKGYEVHAIVRRSSESTGTRMTGFWTHKNFYWYYGDLTDTSNLYSLLMKIQPSEVYNLGAQSHVGISFDVPEYTAQVDAVGATRLLNAIKDMPNPPKYYQASTSELFGGIPGTEPQSETTPFYPKSPYGVAKLYSYWLTVNYRESYNLFAVNGILFNHESPRRGEEFVTKKITKAVANIVKGKQDCLYLGNLDAKRDWGYAKEYVEMMWLMLQHEKPEDFVVATGATYTVRNFCEFAFNYAGIEIEWSGFGVDEIGKDKATGKIVIAVDDKFFRPAEVELLLGDNTKAEKLLGWKPKVLAPELAKIMVDYDMKYDNYGCEE